MKIKGRFVSGILRKVVSGGVAVLIAFTFTFIALPTPAHAAPADAYWVGDGGNWSDAANHWAVVSGGAPGAGNLPDATSNVHFDANSFTVGGQTVTVDVLPATCLDFDWTGATNSPTFAIGGNELQYFGDATLIAAMTLTSTGAAGFNVNGASATAKLTTNGLSIAARVGATNGFSGTLTLQDGLTQSAEGFFFGTGTIDTNGYTVTTGAFLNYGAATALTLGASTFNCTAWTLNAGTTLTANSATIKVTGTGGFSGGGKTYNAVELNGTAHTIAGSNTFSTLTFAPATTQTITFTDGTTQTITTPTITGSAGNMKTLQGSGAGGWNITKAGGGAVTLDYMSISWSTAGPSDWYAGGNSTDGSNNTNWVFNDQTLTFTTQVASGVTMDKDAVTGGSFNGTLGALVGTHNTSTWIDYGLTVGYGSSTAPVNRTTTGAFVVGIPVNLTPGATYHYRFSGSNDAGTFNGNDQEFTFTMPTVVTIAYTDSLGDISTPLQGDLTAMGVASDTYVGIEYGPTVAYGTLSSLATLAGISDYTIVITGYDSTVGLHYRAFTQVGSVFAYGADNTIEGGRAIAYTLIRILLTLVIAAGTIITVLKTIGNPTLMLIFVVIGLIALIFVQAVFG